MIVELYFIIVMTFLQGSTGDCGFTLTFYQATGLVNGQITTYNCFKRINYRIVQLCGGGKYWQIGLSPRIGGEIFGDFGFKSKGTKLVRKYWYS